MVTKVFLTGVTGYIGGDAFYALEKAHPDWEYTLLVRTEEKAKAVKAQYPHVKIVYGDNDSSDVIEKAAAEADIVIHTAESADSVSSAKAIAKGLAAGHTAEKPGYWIHISGTGILTWYDEAHERFGQPPNPEESYNDIKDIDRIVNLPDRANHRDVDKIVIAANSDAVKAAIVAPPTIYGPGRGPGNRRSQQAPDLAKQTLQLGFAPVVGTGLTEWDNVYVHDLSDFLASLAGAAVDPEKRANPEVFGPKAYFFVENGTHTWGDAAQWTAEAAYKQGLIKEAKTGPVEVKDAGNSTWYKNSKSVAERAKKYLGWSPKGPSLKDETPAIVAWEAKALGLTPSQ